VVIGDDDPSVTGRAGLALVAEVDRVLGVAAALETSVGWLKQRRRGLGIGEVLLSAAASMLANGDFMCDLGHLRADRAGAASRAVADPPAPSTFALAAGRLGRRGVARVEAGMGTLIGRWFAAMPAARRVQLGSCRPTIDLDGTDIEVYGSKKEAVAWNHEGRRVGRAHPATWAEAGVVLAGDLGSGRDDPRPSTPVDRPGGREPARRSRSAEGALRCRVLRRLSRAVGPAAVTAMLAGCDRAGPTGRRNFAILVLMVRLGLRAVEVARMALDDVDWRAGEVVIHGKGGRDDRLPGPA
jgi:hypothetical protein